MITEVSKKQSMTVIFRSSSEETLVNKSSQWIEYPASNHVCPVIIKFYLAAHANTLIVSHANNPQLRPHAGQPQCHH